MWEARRDNTGVRERVVRQQHVATAVYAAQQQMPPLHGGSKRRTKYISYSSTCCSQRPTAADPPRERHSMTASDLLSSGETPLGSVISGS